MGRSYIRRAEGTRLLLSLGGILAVACPLSADSSMQVIERQIVERKVVSTPLAGGETAAGTRSDAAAMALDADVAGIELVATMIEDGRRLDLYQNTSRTCGRNGFHTFVIGIDEGIPDSEARPLWIRLVGGGAGWFNTDGSYTRDVGKLNEWRERLLLLFKEPGLMRTIDNDEAGFRFLVPGMCDHDMYSGRGQLDPDNPFQPDENGRSRRVDGMLAIRDAVAFTEMTYTTEEKIVHGTSSGGIGATSLAISYGNSAGALDGIIVDTGTFTPYFAQLVDTGCTEFGDLNIRDAADRLGWTLVQGNDIIESPQLPHVAIEQGILDIPIYELWSRNDHSVCGEQVVDIKLEDGTRVSGEGQELMHMRMRQAIETFNPGGNSVSRVICADRPAGLVPINPGFRACGLHGVTKYSSATVGGDKDRQGEDFNEAVYAWVLSLLPPRADPPGPQDAGRGSGAVDPIVAALALLLVGAARRLA